MHSLITNYNKSIKNVKSQAQLRPPW